MDQASELLSFMRFLEFTFPEASHNDVLVAQDRMTINLYNLNWGMLQLVQKKALDISARTEDQRVDRHFYHVKVRIPLEKVSAELCNWLAVRRCWGIVRLQDWIRELERFLKTAS